MEKEIRKPSEIEHYNSKTKRKTFFIYQQKKILSNLGINKKSFESLYLGHMN